MKNFIRMISVISVSCLLSSVPCFAQDLPVNFEDISPEPAQKDESEEIKLFVNESKILDKEAKRVAVGNPEVADVRVISDKEIIVLGKSSGKTNLIIWNKWDQREVLAIEVIPQDLQRLADCKH